MIEKTFDAIIIGAGAAGMAAASGISRGGFSTAIVEREDHIGGILMQCIHNGFGLTYFKKELTGPEYAEEYVLERLDDNIKIYLDTTAVDIKTEGDCKRVITYSASDGIMALKARAVVLAMGCRERNRGNLGIPGTRPAGIFTAGLAQRLLNIDGYVPGKKVVIIGSGDIGLIMARRLSWTGSKVLAVVEIQPHPSGLPRNIAQCLDDFDIPLYLSHTVTRINGRNRVSSVEVSPMENGEPDCSRSFTLDCDTILLSVGLVPENEFSRKAGVGISHDTGGAVIDADMMTNIDGVFACGNVLHVHDLVDYVTAESETCGRNVVNYLHGKINKETQGAVVPGANLKYVVPNKYQPERENHFYMRPLILRDSAVIEAKAGGKTIFKQKLKYVKPAEMISLKIPAANCLGIPLGEKIEIGLIEEK